MVSIVIKVYAVLKQCCATFSIETLPIRKIEILTEVILFRSFELGT
jgi:hypothetical protein